MQMGTHECAGRHITLAQEVKLLKGTGPKEVGFEGVLVGSEGFLRMSWNTGLLEHSSLTGII